MFAKIFFVLFISSMHMLVGLVSFAVGVFASIKSLIWMAQTVSPIYSGAFFILCGITGLAMSRQRSQYSILCFASLNAVTLLTAIVNMQFLRMGLVNHTTLGKTFQKETKDVLIMIALVADGCEILLCIISLLLSIKLNYDAKNDRFKNHRKEGAFFVQIVSDKDIVVVHNKQPKQRNAARNGFNGLFNKQTISMLATNATRITGDLV